jgi:hypothetical protein
MTEPYYFHDIRALKAEFLESASLAEGKAVFLFNCILSGSMD